MALDSAYLNAEGKPVQVGDRVWCPGRNLSGAGSGFSIIGYDVSNEAAPTRVTTVHVAQSELFYPGEARGVLLLDDWMISGHSGAVVIHDVSNPLVPVEVGRGYSTNTSLNPRMPWPLLIDGDDVLWGGLDTGNSFTWDGIVGVTLQSGGTVILPTTPGRFEGTSGNIAQSGQNGAVGWDDRWVAAVDTGGVRVWDTQDPGAGGVLAACSGTVRSVVHIEIAGVDYLWVPGWGGGQELFDVSDPTTPVELTVGQISVGSSNTASPDTIVAAQPVEWAPWLVVGVVTDDAGNTVDLYDFSVPTAPVRRSSVHWYSGGTLTTSNMAVRYVFCARDRAYITDHNGRLLVYEITEVDQPLDVIGRWGGA